MAEKRMFARKVIETDSFYSLHASAQALYLHLAMSADDDGFVSNVQSVRRACGIRSEFFRELHEKGYIIQFENSSVVLLTHFKQSNYVHPSRYRPSSCVEKTLVELKKDNSYTVKGAGSHSNETFSLRDIDTNAVFCSSQYSIDESSKDKLSTVEGESMLPLTDETYSKLCGLYGKTNVDRYARLVENYYKKKGEAVRDFAATVQLWLDRDGVTNDCADGSSGIDIEEYRQFVNNFAPMEQADDE